MPAQYLQAQLEGLAMVAQHLQAQLERLAMLARPALLQETAH